jgi:hypothetical protein
MAAAGFIPKDYSMDQVFEDLSGYVCDASLTEKFLSETKFEFEVRSAARGYKADPVRVAVHYECPERAMLLEDALARA